MTLSRNEAYDRSTADQVVPPFKTDLDIHKVDRTREEILKLAESNQDRGELDESSAETSHVVAEVSKPNSITNKEKYVVDRIDDRDGERYFVRWKGYILKNNCCIERRSAEPPEIPIDVLHRLCLAWLPSRRGF